MIGADYPVTTPFGQVAGYPLNNGFHNGIDYGFPIGTPVTVNGVNIGISNNTGATTGPHLHVGKFVGGAVQNPGVNNGFQFNSAVVYDTGFDSIDGNYVRITGDGALWNYLHLESTLVVKGQILKGELMDVPNDGDIINLKRAETQVPDYQPPGSELDHYKDPQFGWKALAYDTAKGMQAQIDSAKTGDATILKPGKYQVK